MAEKIGDAFVEIGAQFKGLEKEFGKLDGKLKTQTKKTEKGMSKAFKNIGALAAGAFATQQIISFGKEAIKLAGQLEGVSAAFGKINDPRLLDNLRKATRGTVSDIELMKAAVKAKNFKVPLEKLATFFEFATKRSAETGESVDFLVESIVNGIGRKSSLVLDNLGISATELQAEIKKVGDFGLAAGNIIERELGKMGDVAITSAQEFAKVSAEIQNLQAEIGKILIPIVKDLLSVTLDVAKGFEIIFSGATTEANQFNKAIAKALQDGGQLMGEARVAAKEFKDELGDVPDKLTSIKDEIKRLNTESNRNIKLSETFGKGYVRIAALLKLTSVELQKTVTLFDRNAAATMDNNKASEATVQTLGSLNAQLKTLAEDQGLSTTTAQFLAFGVQIDNVQAKIDKLTGKDLTFGDVGQGETPLSLVAKDMGTVANEAERINAIPLALPAPTEENIMAWKNMLTEMQKTGELAGALNGVFSVLGDSIVTSFGQAQNGAQAFLGSMSRLVIDLIAQMLATSIANSIAGATAAGAAAGPAAPFVTPALIAQLVGGTIAAFAAIPAFAGGGQSRGGEAIVGERGPEKVNLPKGARITPNHEINRRGIGRDMQQNIAVRGVLRGDNIFLSNQRTGVTRTRTAG